MKLASKFATLAFGLTAFSAVQATTVDDMVASAKENLYVGANFSSFDAGHVAPSAIAVHAGAKLHPNLAAEVRLGIGLGDDKGVEVDNYFSVLAKGILPLPTVHEGLSIYGAAGFSRVATSVDGCGSWCDYSSTELALGAGVEFALNPEISLSAEFLMVDEVDVFGIGASYKF